MMRERSVLIADWEGKSIPLAQAINQLVSEYQFVAAATICSAMAEIVAFHCGRWRMLDDRLFAEEYEVEVSLAPKDGGLDIVLLRRRPMSDEEECPAYFL